MAAVPYVVIPKSRYIALTEEGEKEQKDKAQNVRSESPERTRDDIIDDDISDENETTVHSQPPGITQKTVDELVATNTKKPVRRLHIGKKTTGSKKTTRARSTHQTKKSWISLKK